MDKTLFKIIGTVIVVLSSVAIVSLVLFQTLVDNEKEGTGAMNPMFATPTPIPEVKIIKTLFNLFIYKYFNNKSIKLLIYDS